MFQTGKNQLNVKCEMNSTWKLYFFIDRQLFVWCRRGKLFEKFKEDYVHTCQISQIWITIQKWNTLNLCQRRHHKVSFLVGWSEFSCIRLPSWFWYFQATISWSWAFGKIDSSEDSTTLQTLISRILHNFLFISKAQHAQKPVIC